MTPRLSRRGRYAAVSGALMLASGAALAAPPLVSLGGVALASLMTAYLLFFPTAIALSRRQIEMRWWLVTAGEDGGALTPGRSFPVPVSLRNRSPKPLWVLSIDVIASSAVDVGAAEPAGVAAGSQVEVTPRASARAAGYHALHGAVITLGDLFGLFEVRAYFPSFLELKVVPRAKPARVAKDATEPPSLDSARAGRSPSRRRGVAGDVREIREHQRGDPWKLIAWKSTARRGRLMVRELDTEIVSTHLLLLDVAGPMREGEPGRRPLDAALDAAAALGRAALDRGDRVGLIAFSSRVVAELSPGAGPRHHLALVDRLLEQTSVFRLDEIDLDPGALAAAAARYLAHQEGIDARLRRAPGPGDPAWSHVVAGPDGQLYDLALLARVAGALVDKARARAARSPRRHTRAGAPGDDAGAVDPRLTQLARLCKLRGIELPPRRECEPGVRAAALADAASRALSGSRPSSIVLISDLGCVTDDPSAALRPLSRARRAGRRVIALAAPDAPAPDRALDRTASAAAEVLADDARLRLSEARRALAGAGITVSELAPTTRSRRAA